MVNISKVRQVRFWTLWKKSGALGGTDQNRALSMEIPKSKLLNLKQYLTGTYDETVYAFGEYLSGYLNSRLVPQGFVLTCELSLYDLEKGIKGSTQQPVHHQLVGYPPMIYSLLRMYIPDIADAIFPKGYAKKVKEITEHIDAVKKSVESKAPTKFDKRVNQFLSRTGDW